MVVQDIMITLSQSLNIINLSLHIYQEQGKLILCVIDNGFKQRNILELVTAVY